MDTKAGKAGLRIKDLESPMNVMEGCSVQECDFSTTNHHAQYFQQWRSSLNLSYRF